MPYGLNLSTIWKYGVEPVGKFIKSMTRLPSRLVRYLNRVLPKPNDGNMLQTPSFTPIGCKTNELFYSCFNKDHILTS